MQENDDDDEDERARFEKRAINLADGLTHESGGVEWNLVDQPRWKSGSEAVEKFAHPFRGIEGVCSRKLVDGDATGRFTVDFENLAVTTRSQLHPADIAQACDLPTCSAVRF